MPTNTANNSTKRRLRRGVERAVHRRPIGIARKRRKFVRIPLSEYHGLLAARDALEHDRILNDPKTKWIPLDVAIKQFAGDRIVAARKKAGLTQVQLAAKLKMPQSQISRIERNPDRTTVRTLKKIAAALRVDVKALLS